MLARGMRAGCGEPARGPLPNGRRRAQVCLFSYGQSGAGKTHTMQGGRAPDAQGIIPRSVFKARPALPRRALPGRDALSRMRRAAAQRARSVLPLDACAIARMCHWGLRPTGPQQLGMHVCRVHAGGEPLLRVHACPGVQGNL
jgi:hypothetical protein